jgi:hypothetical protein
MSDPLARTSGRCGDLGGGFFVVSELVAQLGRLARSVEGFALRLKARDRHGNTR